MLKRLCLLIAVLVSVFCAVGCSGGIDVYEYYDEDGSLVSLVEIRIDSSYAQSKNVSVNEFYEYVTRFLIVVRYREVSNPNRTPTFSIKAVSESTTERDQSLSSSLSDPRIVEDNGFLRLMEVKIKSPFNGIFDSVEGQPSSANMYDRSFAAVFARGYQGDNIKDYDGVPIYLQPFFDTFPTLKADAGAISLGYFFSASNVRTDGTAVIVDGKRYYMWKQSFDSTTQEMTIQYFAPNTLGYNIVAITAGAITVAIILLVTRKKKDKRTFRDIIPYDPNQAGGSGDNLPTV